MRKQINKNLLCSTGNSTQYSLLTYVEKESEKECAVFCLATQLCLTRGNPIDCSPSVSSVHGILQARILEWVAMPFSRGSSDPGIKSASPALAGFFTTASWDAHTSILGNFKKCIFKWEK